MWGSLIILLLTFVLLPRYYLVTHTLQQKLSSVLNKHNIIQDITKKCCESVYIMWIFWSKLHTSFIIIQGEVELCEYVLTMSLFFSDNYNNQKLKKHMSHEQHIFTGLTGFTQILFMPCNCLLHHVEDNYYAMTLDWAF